MPDTGVRGVEDFLTHLEKERDVSPNTVIAYRRDLEEFVAFLGGYFGVQRSGRGRGSIAWQSADFWRTSPARN